MTILPPFLDIPLTTAEGVEFDGLHLSARDISYAVAAAWIAARSKPMKGSDDWYRIPDNRLRAALGRNRRDGIDVEIARFERLKESVLLIDGRSLPMPTVMYRNGAPYRGTLDDELTWVVDPEVVDLFRASPASILLPTALLANARHCHTVEILMRILAAHTRGPGGAGVVSWALDRIGLRLTFPEIVERFHLPVDLPPSVLMQKWLTPASRDVFDATGISLDVEPRRRFAGRDPRGSYHDALIYAVMPGMSPLEQKVREQQSNSWTKRKSTGKPRGRPRKPAEPVQVLEVADTNNVTVLRQPTPVSIFNSSKGQPIGSVKSEPDDDTLEF